MKPFRATKPFLARLWSAVLVASALAGGVATVRLIAQVIPPQCLPLGCFQAGTESEIWQSIAPFGVKNDANLCTNSDPADPLEAFRQCGPGLTPPPLGQFMYPFAVAADGPVVYVVDQYNHRVQAFTWNTGTPVVTPRPFSVIAIGDGTYGSDDNHLNAPEGIVVTRDSGGNHLIAVADAYNHRLAIFNTDGTRAFAQHFPVQNPNNDPLSPSFPTGLAMSPGTTVLGYQVPAGADTHQIVVTDRINCYVYIYDAGFNLRHQVPAVAPPGGACVVAANPSTPAPLGFFGSPEGAAVDAAGHIFITDYDNSRVQILDSNGNPLGSFGTPPDPNATIPPGSLQGPYGVIIDHTGRIVVSDTDNQRIAFFTANFATNPPTVAFQFQLDAGGTLNGSPTGIAEQVSADTDPAGRILSTDTQNHRVQRFQLPDLAVVRAVLDSTTVPPSGTFGVVVPAQKSSVVGNVIAAVVHTPGGDATVLSGPTAASPANPLLPISINPGQIVNYSFTYTPGATPVSFDINATGTGGVTARTVTVVPSVVCADCATTAQVFVGPAGVTPAVTHNGFYITPLVVRVSATSSNPGGLQSIAYQFTGVEAAIQGGGVHLVNVSGSSGFVNIPVTHERTSDLHYWAVNANGSAEAPHVRSFSLDLTPPSVAFSFVSPPTGHDAANAPWFNGAASIRVSITDDISGAATPNSVLTFAAVEGRNQHESVVASDNATNTTGSVDSLLNGLLPVNIDLRAPALTVPAATTLELTGPGVAVIPAGSPQAASFMATASDPLLATGAAGSGVVSLLNPAAGATTFPMVGAGPTTTAWTFRATDGAGNSASQNVNVTVRDTTPPALSCPAAFAVTLPGGGGATTVPVVDLTTRPGFSASDLSGSATVTQSPAANSLPALIVGARTITLTAKDPTGNTSTCTTTVTVQDADNPTLNLPAPITTTATGAGGAVVTFTATYTDAVDGTRPATCTPASGSTFPVGSTTVSCTATNTRGKTTTGSFVVTVNPLHSAPVCTAATASPGSLWPPNHRLVTIAINGLTTADGGAITTLITSIFQDEPTFGLKWGEDDDDDNRGDHGGHTSHGDHDGGGDGDTPIDGFGVGTSQAQVRAERSGRGNGRVYYIGFKATTAGGNCTGAVTVGVPHDQAHPTVGEGPRYDSTKSGVIGNDQCHGRNPHGHHDGDGCIAGHHGHFDGDNCHGKDDHGRESYHHNGDGDRNDNDRERRDRERGRSGDR